MEIKVKVQTFRESGKYYDEFEYKYDIDSPNNWYNLLDKIKEDKSLNRLPQSNMIYVVSESLCENYGFPHIIF